jgi:hypothetical protein
MALEGVGGESVDIGEGGALYGEVFDDCGAALVDAAFPRSFSPILGRSCGSGVAYC